MGALSAASLMAFLPMMTWIRLLIWFAIGMVIYFFYGFRNSKLAGKPSSQKPQ
jgi:APA family basic amino acid/polyamine antiporter